MVDEQATITIGGRSFTANIGTFEKVFLQFDRKARGRPGTILDTPDERTLFEDIAQATGFFRQGAKATYDLLQGRIVGRTETGEVIRGVGVQELTRRGFTPLETTQILSGQTTPAEKAAQQSLLPQYRYLNPRTAPAQNQEFQPREPFFTPAPQPEQQITQFGFVPPEFIQRGFTSTREFVSEVFGGSKETTGQFEERKTQQILGEGLERKKTQLQGLTMEQLNLLSSIPETGITREPFTPVAGGASFSISPTQQEFKTANQQARTEFFELPFVKRANLAINEGVEILARGQRSLIEFPVDIGEFFYKSASIESPKNIFGFPTEFTAGRKVSENLGYVYGLGSQEKKQAFVEFTEAPLSKTGRAVELGGAAALIAAGFGPGVFRAGRLISSEGVIAAGGELIGELLPIRIKPGVYTPEVAAEQFTGNLPLPKQFGNRAVLDVGIEGMNIRQQVFSAEGRNIPELSIKGIGVSGEFQGRPVQFAVTEFSTPFIEVTSRGRINTGTIKEIRQGFSNQIGKDFPASAFLGRTQGIDVSREFPAAKTIQTKYPYDTSRAIVGERPLTNVQLGGVEIEEFAFASGQPSIKGSFYPGDYILKPIKKLSFGEDFFAQISGTGISITRKAPPGFLEELGGFKSEDNLGKVLLGEGQESVIVLNRKTTRPFRKLKTTDEFLGAVQSGKQEFQRSLSISNNKQKISGVSQFSSILGGAGAVSEFAGLGTYERTEMVSFGNFKEAQTLTIPGLDFKRKEPVLFTTKDFAQVRTLNRERQLLFLSGQQLLLQVQPQRTELRELQITKQSEKLGSGLQQDILFDISFAPQTFDFPFRGTGRGRFAFPGFIPGIELPKERKTRIAKGRKFRRTASIISVGLGIKNFVSNIPEETGLGIRPLSAGRKGRRNKILI